MVRINRAAVIEPIFPDRDSQYRLRPCRCGCEKVGYIQLPSGERKPWAVRCFGCGRTGERFQVRHDAQVYWNTHLGARPIVRRPM